MERSQPSCLKRMITVVTDKLICINAVFFPHYRAEPAMSTLEKIIFLADAIEPGQGLSVRSKTAEKNRGYTDLDRACMDYAWQRSSGVREEQRRAYR